MIVVTHSYPQQWIQYGAPKSFWISGFFYPQGNQYLTLYETDISTECDHSNEICCAVRSCGRVLFIMLYMVVLTFEYVDKILKCDHSIESY